MPTEAIENNPAGTLEDDSDILDAFTSALEESTADEGEQAGADAESNSASEGQEEAETGKQAAEPQKLEPRYRVKVDGKEEEVTLDELQAGYQRSSDYTRKTQAIAQQRKEAEQLAFAVQAERQQYQNSLKQLAAQMQQMAPPPPDDSLRFTNPAEFAAQAATYQQHLNRAQALAGEFQRTEQIRLQHEAVARERMMQEAMDRIPELIPEWKDPKVFRAEQAAVTEYGLNQGYSADELASTSDPRAVAILRKAMKYDQLVERQKQVKPKVSPIKTAVPGGAPAAGTKTRDYDTAMKRLDKSGSVEDAVAALLAG